MSVPVNALSLRPAVQKALEEPVVEARFTDLSNASCWLQWSPWLPASAKAFSFLLVTSLLMCSDRGNMQKDGCGSVLRRCHLRWMSGRGAAIKAPADSLLKLQAHWGRRQEQKKIKGKSKIVGKGGTEVFTSLEGEERKTSVWKNGK